VVLAKTPKLREREKNKGCGPESLTGLSSS